MVGDLRAAACGADAFDNRIRRHFAFREVDVHRHVGRRERHGHAVRGLDGGTLRTGRGRGRGSRQLIGPVFSVCQD